MPRRLVVGLLFDATSCIVFALKPMIAAVMSVDSVDNVAVSRTATVTCTGGTEAISRAIAKHPRLERPVAVGCGEQQHGHFAE